ncbi:MAG: hypothetical protein SYC29_00830, partial [Planctomycetota bacterium]|nr:hypothetical protein [Planctomycetota bacterium]
MSTQTTHIHTEIADTPRRRPAWAPLADLFLNALFPDRDGDVMASERSFVEGIARAAKKSGACEEPTVYDGKTSRTVEEIDACDQDITDDKTIATFAVPDLLQLFRALRLAATLRTAEDAVALLAPRAVTILEIDIDTCSDLQDELPKLLWRCQRALDIDVETDFEYRPRIVTPPRSSESRVEMRRFAGDVRDHLSKPAPLIVLRDRGYRLPDALVRALPSPVVLAPLDRDIVLEALVWSHAPMDAATRAKVLDVLPFDDHLARVDSLDLLMAFRADDPVGVAHRLAAFVTVPAPSDGPDLNDIIGYGEAEAVARGMLS